MKAFKAVSVFLKYFAFSIFVLLITGCNHDLQQVKFNRVQWDDGDIEIYPNREAMLNDLITNYHLKGMNYRQITKLLGEPHRQENINIDSPYYVINTDYGNDIDPVYSKTLTIFLNNDSVVTGYKVNEWQKHQ